MGGQTSKVDLELLESGEIDFTSSAAVYVIGLVVAWLLPYSVPAIAMILAIDLAFGFSAVSRALNEPRAFRYGLYSVMAGVAAAFIVAYAVMPTLLATPLIHIDSVGVLKALWSPAAAAYAAAVISGHFARRAYEALSEAVAPLSAEASSRFRDAARWFWLSSLLAAVVGLGMGTLVYGYERLSCGFEALEASLAQQTGSQQP